MPASPPDATRSQLDASQFHSEFGYLAPTIRFRRKAGLTLKPRRLGNAPRCDRHVCHGDGPRGEGGRHAVHADGVRADASGGGPQAGRRGALRPAIDGLPHRRGRTFLRPGASWRRVAAPAAGPVTPEPPAVVATPVAPAVAMPSTSGSDHATSRAGGRHAGSIAPTAITPADDHAGSRRAAGHARGHGGAGPCRGQGRRQAEKEDRPRTAAREGCGARA